MDEPDDMQLLREYAAANSEDAFAALVQRHVNLVYSVALRQVGDSHKAQDVTQAVFIILARKAASLRRETILTGWLYQTARLTSASFLRGEIRRQHREQESFMQSTLDQSQSGAAWEQLAPLLDDAMGRLGHLDRNLLLLRFFEGKSTAEAAAALHLNEPAAKKRCTRAIEKLRQFFSRRGVDSTTATITGTISTHSIQVAPALLAKSVTAVALAKGATASASTLTLIKGALKIMAWTKAKMTIVAGTVVLLAVGTASTVVVKTVINKKMEALAAYQGQVWQQKYDVSMIDRLPAQVMILPALRSRATPGEQIGRLRNGKVVGLGVGVPEIMQNAYDVSLGRIIFSSPIPIGRYDFIDNLPTGQQEALQQAVKKKFGLSGKRQLIETNVLVLTMRYQNAAGLRPVSGQDAFDMGNGSISGRDRPFAVLIYGLEDILKIPVVNKTGLTGNFDFDIKWDSTPEGLKQAVRQQLGLELVPNREAIEFVVVSKEK